MKKIVLYAIAFIVAALVASYLSASNDPDPFDFEDCEDLSEIPPEYESGDFLGYIPFPGYMIETTCGEAALISNPTTGLWLSFPTQHRIKFFRAASSWNQAKCWAMIWKGQGFLISSFMTRNGNKSFTHLSQTSPIPTR